MMETRWGLSWEEIRQAEEKALEDMEQSPELLWPAKAEIDAMSEQAHKDMGRFYQTSRRFIIRATLRHVYEEGEKPCPHNLKLSDRPAYKRECGWCWAELKKECS